MSTPTPLADAYVAACQSHSGPLDRFLARRKWLCSEEVREYRFRLAVTAWVRHPKKLPLPQSKAGHWCAPAELLPALKAWALAVGRTQKPAPYELCCQAYPVDPVTGRRVPECANTPPDLRLVVRIDPAGRRALPRPPDPTDCLAYGQLVAAVETAVKVD